MLIHLGQVGFQYQGLLLHRSLFVGGAQNQFLNRHLHEQRTRGQIHRTGEAVFLGQVGNAAVNGAELVIFGLSLAASSLQALQRIFCQRSHTGIVVGQFHR